MRSSIPRFVPLFPTGDPPASPIDPEIPMLTKPSFTTRAMLLTIIVAPALLAQSGAPVAQQFEKLHFRSIGPAIMSGRIADITVYEKNTSIWYAGAAHGGVW